MHHYGSVDERGIETRERDTESGGYMGLSSRLFQSAGRCYRAFEYNEEHSEYTLVL